MIVQCAARQTSDAQLCCVDAYPIGKGTKLSYRRSVLGLVLLLTVISVVAAPALATTIHGDFIGTDIDFLGVQETSTFGDPEPACCFGAPIVVGNQLLFFPASFSASSAGGGVDQTGAQLQSTVMTNTLLGIITTITIDEFGDALLTGSGTAATGTFASLAGFVTVLETLSGPIAPVIIPFTGTFTPSDFLGLPADLGTTLWTGHATIDVGSVVPNATKVFLSIDNNLVAASEAGTSALIQKKVVSGPGFVINVIPEPNTAILLCMGLIGLATQRRRRP